MPILDFKCVQCGNVFDELVKSSEHTTGVLCPKCGSDQHTRVYQGKCYGIGKAQCSHNCATCSGCQK